MCGGGGGGNMVIKSDCDFSINQGALKSYNWFKHVLFQFIHIQYYKPFNNINLRARTKATYLYNIISPLSTLAKISP